MNKLPNSILLYIYSFDSTYHEIFNKVKEELKTVTSMWKIYFFHKDLKENFKTRYNISLNQASNLSNYWNKEFLKNNYANSYIRYYDNVKGFCEPRHISDNLDIKNYFSRLKANIQSSKIVLSWK